MFGFSISMQNSDSEKEHVSDKLPVTNCKEGHQIQDNNPDLRNRAACLLLFIYSASRRQVPAPCTLQSYHGNKSCIKKKCIKKQLSNRVPSPYHVHSWPCTPWLKYTLCYCCRTQIIRFLLRLLFFLLHWIPPPSATLSQKDSGNYQKGGKAVLQLL